MRGHNPRSIGIELVNTGRYPHWRDSKHQAMDEPYPEAQVVALIALLAHLQAQFPSVKFIAGHEDLDRDPRLEEYPNFDFNRFIDYLTRGIWPFLMQLIVGVGSMSLMLVVAVAAFNIISTLVMVVKEKRADIAILRTLGAAPRDMIGIFMTQGSVIGVVGTVAGVLLGLLIAANVTAITSGLERLMGVTLVDPRVYFIAELPADVRGSEVLVIAAVALALGVLATLYPAWRAATTQPAESLRHEV